MTNEELIREFSKWVNSGKGDVWYRKANTKKWCIAFPNWEGNGHYIVEDKHTEFRKLKIDKPSTEFEFRKGENDWSIARHPNWDVKLEYRVKAEPVYEWQYTYKTTTGNAKYALTEHMAECNFQGYIRLDRSKRIRND